MRVAAMARTRWVLAASATLLVAGVLTVRLATRVDAATALLGRVRTPDGEPVAGAALTLFDESGVEVDSGVTGDDGTCVLSAPRGADCTLLVVPSGARPLAQHVRADDLRGEVTVVLAGNGSICGLVRDLAGTVPVRGASVVVTAASGGVLGAQRTDATGYYAFDGLTSGCYVLAVDRPGRRPFARAIVLSAEEPTVCDVDLVHCGRIVGVVRDADNRPVEGVTVVLTDRSSLVRTVITGAGGRYSFHDLLAGDYALATAPDGDRVAVRVSRAEHQRDLHR